MLIIQNILQYEFFHVGGKGKSFEDMQEEMRERVLENLPLALAGDDTGPRIKTVVRIYDVDGYVTALVQELDALQSQREACWFASRDSFLEDFMVKWKLRRILKKIDRLLKKILEFYFGYLKLSATGNLQVAKESWEHAFRPAREDEILELIQAGKKSVGFWIFVFEPNELLSDNNKTIVCKMS